MNTERDNDHESKRDHDVHAQDFSIVVNARPREVAGREVSFLRVVQLAFEGATINETTVYTVTYKRGPHQNPQGSMVEGDVVRIKNEMIFNVTRTDKS